MTNEAKDELIFKLTNWAICPNVNVNFHLSKC